MRLIACDARWDATVAAFGRAVVDAAGGRRDHATYLRAGPESMTFREYVRRVAQACGVRRFIVRAPAWVSLFALRLLERFLRDKVLTREELEGLAQEKLLSRQAPRGTASVTDWLRANGASLGLRYVNDLDRHFRAGAHDAILVP